MGLEQSAGMGSGLLRGENIGKMVVTVAGIE